MLFWIHPTTASQSSLPCFVLAKVKTGVNGTNGNYYHLVIIGVRGPPEGSTPSVTLLQDGGDSYFKGVKLI